MASRRPVILLGAAVLVAVLGGAWWMTRDTRGNAEPAQTAASAPPSLASAQPTRPELPPTSSSKSVPASGIPGLIPADQPPPPPSPNDPPPKPRPERKVRTPAEELEMKKEAVKLLDRNIERLEGDLATAQKSGDHKTADALRIRLERLRDTRKKQAAEVEQGAAPQ